ncbi:MAG: glycoside hydrolase family 30 protein [Breznakibacter sp.]
MGYEIFDNRAGRLPGILRPKTVRFAGEYRFSAQGKIVSVYTTADSTNLRLALTEKQSFGETVQPLETETSVFIYPARRFQTFLGIGGAVTDASAEVFAKLTPGNQEAFLTAYFDGQKGIGYSLLRTTIHSCDFSPGSYTYVEEDDGELETFSIGHDRQYRIPLIKRAIETAGGQMVLYASPWSPPAFMKDNNHMLRGGKLLPEYNQTWADYYVKFIKAYEAEGIPVWGISIQNEPMAVQRWESCIFTAEDERDFLKNYLGPTMHKTGLGDRKIIVWDHNRDLMVQRAHVIFDDPDASKYAWGIGYHWYETWSGGNDMSANVAEVSRSFPDKNILFTEGCVEKFDSARYQYWPNAEKYGRSMITDFNNGTVGWTDWNILLDQHGGPNHVGNYCFAPVHGHTQTGQLVFTPVYYYIGHFSKFIRPGAVRVSASTSHSNLMATSFLNTDGKMATVVMNPTSKQIKYKLIVDQSEVEVNILPHAIQTLVY